MTQRSDSIHAASPMRMVLMGTGPFAVPSFEALREAGHELLCVVTRPQPPIKSRKGPPPSPVRSWAEQHSLPIFDPESINTPEAIAAVDEQKPALLVVCDYGQILKPAALATATLGGINLHGSLLPKYRGAAPVQRALLGGEQETGVSVIHMTPRLDGGPVVTTRRTPIDPNETAGELEERLSLIGVEATLEAVGLISKWDGVTSLGEAQDPNDVTKAPRLSKAEAEIDWGRNASEIDCLVRGMQPWPIAFTHFPLHGDKPPLRLAIKQIRQLSDEEVAESVVDPSSLSPGQIATGDGLYVATSGGIIEVLRLQPAGKREMTGAEFVRGHQPDRGTCFVSRSAN